MRAIFEEDTMKATWNGVTIAESDQTVLVDGNHYFPPESVNHELLERTWMKCTSRSGEESRFIRRLAPRRLTELQRPRHVGQ